MRLDPRPDVDDEQGPRPGERVSSRPPLELPIKAASPRAKARSELLLLAAMVGILLACAFAFRGTKDGEKLPRPLIRVSPLTIADLHPRIRSVFVKAPGDGALEITLVQSAPMYPASVVTDLSQDALAVSRGLKEHFPDLHPQTIRFIAKAPPVTAFGPGKVPIAMLALDFDRSDLMERVAVADFSFQALLNRATGMRYLDPSAAGYVAAFCGDPVARAATLFCAREAP
ncbi:hypothetical protein QTH97_28165 [Variovorax sp. J22R24]|uniref:hypothetical protein n=1 Tax=Variovorax gracilis TaxID=3053502 RepID=UPI002574FD87|nr:hypothetical protein [Variovorax sp. J22R24]MDM0108848.1 hypothetical protein [Variovorax sp. J22R24]